MALKTMLDNIKRAREQIKAEAAQEVTNHFKAVLPEGFELRWEQYTPYFNDGDPCIFGVRDPYLVSTKADINESLYDLEEQGLAIEFLGNNANLDGCTQAQIRVLAKAWKDLVEQAGGDKRDYVTSEPAAFDYFMCQAFGDHIVVRILPEGKWATSACDHD